MAKRPASRRVGKRQASRLFQFRDQWIGREAGSPNYFRYWYDGDRHTRRESLKTADLEQAKEKLIRIVLGDAPKDPESPDAVYFGTVARHYLDKHVIKIRAQAAARRAFDLATTYLQAETGKAAPMVSDFSLDRQEAFMQWCRDEHQLSAKSISTYMSSIRAAMVFASRPRTETDSKGERRTVRILSAPFPVEAGEKQVAEITGLQRSLPREFIPNDAQLAAFIDAIYNESDEKQVRECEHVFRYVIMALNTWARPEAITELNVAKQVDFQNGLVYLNPPGRPQNKKFRPTIRLTDNLRGWLHHWNVERPIVLNGQPVREVSPKTFEKIRARVGLPQMVRYSLRHYMNTRAMRMPPDIRPDREERAIWMGHADPLHKQTQQYEHFSPDYLVRPMKATDAIIAALDQLSTKSLFVPGTASKGLYVVERRADG